MKSWVDSSSLGYLLSFTRMKVSVAAVEQTFKYGAHVKMWAGLVRGILEQGKQMQWKG